MVKRVTPEEDIDRLAERLRRFSREKIDEENFDEIFDDYMEALTPEQDTLLRRKVRQKLRLERIPKRKVRKARKPRQQFPQVGKVKKKIVFARQTQHKLKGKTVTVFRDRKGRFVKVKKK